MANSRPPLCADQKTKKYRVNYRSSKSGCAVGKTGATMGWTSVIWIFFGFTVFIWPMHSLPLAPNVTWMPAAFDLLDQPVHPARRHHLRSQQKPLAGGAVLQMEQAASAHQGILWTSENAVKTQIWIANSVYPLVAIVKKNTRPARLSLHFITGALSYIVRENAHFTGTSADGSH